MQISEKRPNGIYVLASAKPKIVTKHKDMLILEIAGKIRVSITAEELLSLQKEISNQSVS